jgi:hypothetical protein
MASIYLTEYVINRCVKLNAFGLDARCDHILSVLTISLFLNIRR